MEYGMDVKNKDGINEVRLLHETIQPFKDLNGFQKHHRVPQTESIGNRQFLAEITAPDLDADLQQTYSSLRSGFGLKRKELTVTGPVDGAGVIVTPFFAYEINAFLCEEDVSRVAWRSAISQIRVPDHIFSDSFQNTFGNRFSILEVTTAAPLNIETIIDHVEDAELDSVSVNFDKDATWCEIRVANTQASVHVKDHSIRINSLVDGSPRKLLETFLDFQQQFLASLDCGGNPFMADSP